jgi:hypothetical protein
MGPMSRAQTSWPKPPKQALTEMDYGTEALDQVSLQINKNGQHIDQELEPVHQAVQRLGVVGSWLRP